MATSQFTIYQSIDAGAPILSGATGSVVNLLNSILVTGYGDKPKAGWIVDYTSSIPSGSTFRPPSGSSNAFYLSVTDRNDYGGAGMASAIVCGLENATSFNTGSARFPTSALHADPYGLTLCKNIDGPTAGVAGMFQPRPWVCFADAYTFYLFVKSAHTTAGYGLIYYSLFFGDFYSFKQGDLNNCLIVAGAQNQSFTAGANHQDTSTLIYKGCPGHFAVKSYGGGLGCVNIGKFGTNSFAWSNGELILYGDTLTEVNPENNSYFMSPVFVTEPTASCIRGKFRGMYYIAANNSIVDGEQFSGSGDYAGKTFWIVKMGVNGGIWAIETSNTIDVV